ncbi:MAG TPA: hypothetical protein VMZ28_28115 [Kofleriaceae bacterium]|nr:hypothetical protein [Kofleriaceae bacterium]
MARFLVVTGVLLAAAAARLAPPCASAAAPSCSAALCDDDTGPDLSDLDALPVETLQPTAPDAVATRVTLSVPREAVATGDLLLVAPKTSPPAVVA